MGGGGRVGLTNLLTGFNYTPTGEEIRRSQACSRAAVTNASWNGILSGGGGRARPLQK